MITTKERSSLKALAHNLTPVVIVGKEGLTSEVIKSVDSVLEARELIKIKILNNCPLSPRELMPVLCESVNAEPVQCIGSIVIIYRKSHKKNIEHIVF